MPEVVTHILVPLIIAGLLRDFFYKKNKKKFPLHYILIAGIAGILPDIDIIFFWIFEFLGKNTDLIHKTYTHNIFIPLIFVLLFFIFTNVKIKELGKHKLRLNIIFLMLAFGSMTHLFLDAFLWGAIVPFYPFSLERFSFNLLSDLGGLENIALGTIDGILLVFWIIYLELKHKISDFI